MGMRLLQAARLSRMDDASTGMDKQDEAAERYAYVSGDTIVATAPDTNVSGDTDPFTRPKLGPYLTKPELIASYDGIVAAFLDRFGRSARHLATLRAWAEDHNKTLVVISPSLKWPVEPDDIGSKIMWAILELMAEYELDMIKRRSADTRAKLLRDECLVGRPLYGYLVIPKGDHKTMAPYPREADIVREMVRRYLAGETLQAIADDLNRRGVPSPNWRGKPGAHWYVNTISFILRNPTLTGRRVSSDGKTILRVEPLISIADFKAVAARMDRRAHRKGVPPKQSAMLTSTLFCGGCARPMYQIVSGSGSQKRVPYYYCRKTDKGGCGTMVPLAGLDEAVSDAVMANADLPHMVVAVTPGDDHDDEIEQTRADIRELDPETDDYMERLSALRAELSRLRGLPSTPAKVTRRPSGLTVGELWASLDVAGRRQWLIDNGWRIEARKAAKRGGEPLVTIEAREYLAELRSLRILAASGTSPEGRERTA